MASKRFKPHDIIIDCSDLCRAGFYVFGDDLTSPEGRTGIAFYFLGKILKIAKDFKCDRFIFCWDSKRSRRKLIYPDYKGNRVPSDDPKEKEKEKSYHEQYQHLQHEVIPRLGFKNTFCYSGLESDDLIAHFALDLSFRGPEYHLVVARDHDLHQLLHCCNMYDIVNDSVFTRDDFIAKWGIQPQMWPIVKGYAGCTTDNVANIPGVKEETAIKYMNHDLPEHYKTHQRIKSEEGQAIFERNFKLVKLPYMTLNLKLHKDEVLKREDFADVFVDLQMQTFLKNFDSWCEAFNLK